MGSHPSECLGGRGSGQGIRRRYAIARLVRRSKSRRLGLRVEGILRVALVRLLRHAVAIHHGRLIENEDNGRRRETGTSLCSLSVNQRLQSVELVLFVLIQVEHCAAQRSR